MKCKKILFMQNIKPLDEPMVVCDVKILKPTNES